MKDYYEKGGYFIKKKILAILAITLTTILICCSSVLVYAEPRYSNNNKITLSITFSENEAVCYAKIKGDTGTTSITNCTISLKDSNGNEVKSWSNLSSKSPMLVCSKTTSNITKGETYTLSVSAYVNRNGSSEYVSDSVSKKY